MSRKSWLAVCPFIFLSLLQAAGTAELSKKQTATLMDGVVPAYRQGDPLAVLKILSPLAADLNEDRLAAADALLAKENVPAVSSLLGEARLRLVVQGAGTQLPTPKPREAALAALGMKQAMQEFLADKAKHPALSDPLPEPESLEEYRQLFWSIHVLENQLQATRKLAAYAAGIARLVPEKMREKLSDDQREAVQTNWNDVAGEMADVERALEESEIALRLKRLAIAVEKLAQPEVTKERFLAAGAIEEDAPLLAEFFKRNDPAKIVKPFQHAELNQPDLVAATKQSIERGRKLAGPLLAQGRLLFEGLHWWLRGRYGQGTEGWGLLKPDGALKSGQINFALYMPLVAPKPTDPFEKGVPVPMVERRHHYTWRLEPRGFAYQPTGESETIGGEEKKFVIKTRRFY
jgi:hypothetical protein